MPALEEFFKRIILNYLIGNADAHLKNFSIFRVPAKSDYQLTPNYDVLNTRYHIKNENTEVLPSKGNFSVDKGDIISIRTPGGGGFGNIKK